MMPKSSKHSQQKSA